MKFDMLAPCRMVLSTGCNVPQLRTIGLGVPVGDGSAWVCKQLNPRGWFTPSRDWELLTKEVLEQCNDILMDAGRVRSQWVPSKAKEACKVIMELVCPSTNTFITPNTELGFFLIEMRDVFGLPILSKLYGEFNPLNSILERDRGVLHGVSTILCPGRNVP